MFNHASSSTIVFIDSGVDQNIALAEGINSNADAYILERESDAIEQITDVLAAYYPAIESVHIISHGVPGCLYLGSTELSLSSLDRYRPLLQQWFSDSHHPSPSLALYGCNAAAGDAGEEFFRKLHQITGAQLYGATQKVGNPAQGGTWQLSPQASSTSTSAPLVPLSRKVISTYSGTFALQTFDDYGIVSTSLESDFALSNVNLFFNDNGKLIVGGTTKQLSKALITDESIFISRNSDGSIDENFAGNGVLIDRSFLIRDLIPSVGNTFLSIGTADPSVIVSSASLSALRYREDGTVDTSFGTNGRVTLGRSASSNLSLDDSFNFVTDASGRIISVGSTDGTVRVIRFNADGSTDSSFGNPSEIEGAVGSGFGESLTEKFGDSFRVHQTIIVDNDGKILISGHVANGSSNDFFLVRYNSDGFIDETFGTGGLSLTDFGDTDDINAKLTIDSNGKLLLSGTVRDTVTGNTEIALARYNSDGSLDDSFGVNGLVRRSVGVAGQSGLEVVEVAGGKLVQKATIPSNTVFPAALETILLRYNSDGSIDRSFGQNGVGKGIDGPLAVDANGQLFGAFTKFEGFTETLTLTNPELVVARYDDVLENTETFLSLQTDTRASNFGQVSAVSLSPLGISSTVLERSITDTSWQFQTAGDFNSDGQEDVVLRQFGGSNQTLLWTMTSDGTAIASERLIGRPVEDPNWSIKGSADFNNDGNTDLLLRNATADQNVVWYLDDQQNIVSEELIGRGFQDNNWKIIATNDFNADGEADILLRNEVSTQLLVWQLNGDQIEAEYLAGRTIPDTTNWRVEGSRDFNNDGHADLLVRNSAVQNGLIQPSILWLMKDGQIQHELTVSALGSPLLV